MYYCKNLSKADMKHNKKKLMWPITLWMIFIGCIVTMGLQFRALAEDSPQRHSFPLDAQAKPAIGNIKGIKLSIPHNYLLSGVHYRGEEV
jgi:hypothetical protein